MKIDKNIKIISFFLLLIVLMVTVTTAVSAADTNNAITLTQTNDNTINGVNEDLSTSTSLNDTTSLSNNNEVSVYKATESGDNLKTVDAGKIQLDNDVITYDNLNDAIFAANEKGAGNYHTITVGAGTYTGTGNVGVTINQGFTNLTIKADDGATVIFDAGNPTDKAVIILNIAKDNNVFLYGLTFTGVNGTVATTSYRSGDSSHAILNYGNLTVDNCKFLNNHIPKYSYGDGGAAIHNLGTGLFVKDSIFINNTGIWKGSCGGAIYSEAPENVSITNSYFENNSARFGGAVEFEKLDQNVQALENCTFLNNSAYVGGAVDFNAYCKNVSVNNCSFLDNYAYGPHGSPTTGTQGGALAASSLKTKIFLTLTNSKFIGNYIPENGEANWGGAVALADNVSGDLENNIFINNTASYGGAMGVGIYTGQVNNITIKNSTFINNTANVGGGITVSTGINMPIINSSFINNKANEEGGAVNNFGNISIVDSTLNNNIAPTGSAVCGQDGNNLTIKNSVVTAPEGSTEPAVVNTGSSTIAPILTSNDVSVKTGDSAIVKVNVENPNNQTLIGTVTFAVDGNSQTVNIDSDNTATATLSVLSSGAHTVTITYNGEDENYTTSNTKVTVSASNYATTITNTELNSVENGTVDVNVASSKTVYTGTVNLIYNNKAIGTANVKDGVATIDLSGLDAGSYNVTAFYFGKDSFESTSKLLTLTVTASNVTENNISISVPSISGESGANTIVVVNVTGSEGNVVDSGNVTVNIGNATYSANVVNGSASVNITLPSTVGVNNITVTYVNGSYSTSVNSTINVINNVTSNVTVLTGDNLSTVYGNGDNYTGKLVDANGNAISGQHIKITLTRVSNGLSKDYWVTTDTNGEYQLQINLGQGLYTAQATYAGEHGYEPSTSSLNNIIVTSTVNGTLLTANTFNQKVNAGQNFTGKLVDSNGNVIAGQHISVNLTRLSNGLSKVYWVTTDTNGEYQLAINLGTGSYTADCSYAGTSTYTSSTAHATLTVTA